MTTLCESFAKCFVLVWCLIQFLSYSVEAPRAGTKRKRPPVTISTDPVVDGCLIAKHDFIKEGCACNFMGACSLDSSTGKYKPFVGRTIDPYLPDVEKFGPNNSLVVKICEPGRIGIIYDCMNRIPLASTIVLTKDDYNSKYSNSERGSNDFYPSDIIHPNFRQNFNDYHENSKQKPCYWNAKRKSVLEQDWYRAVTYRSIGVDEPCDSRIKDVTVHRGHLIAAQYGRGGRVLDTFRYINVVPQFGTLNSGAWNQYEKKVIKWTTEHCNNFPVHIIVGSIPSTFSTYQPRFFGKGGFSYHQGNYFAINVPKLMWTVACCKTGDTDFKNTGFYAYNYPGRHLVKRISPSELLKLIRWNHGVIFNFFPSARGQCENDMNFIDVE